MSNLQSRIQEAVEDGLRRGYRPQRFIQALGLPCDDATLLENAKRLLRNPEGQVAAIEYKWRYPDGLTLEDIVVAEGAALGFDQDDVTVARSTLSGVSRT